jgi:hypothetical protein
MGLTVMALTVLAPAIMIGVETGAEPAGTDPSSQHSACHATVRAFGPDRKPRKTAAIYLELSQGAYTAALVCAAPTNKKSRQRLRPRE